MTMGLDNEVQWIAQAVFDSLDTASSHHALNHARSKGKKSPPACTGRLLESVNEPGGVIVVKRHKDPATTSIGAGISS